MSSSTTNNKNSSSKHQQRVVGGWNAVWGCTNKALALFRICLGSLLTLELVLRFRFLHPFYSDQGTLPLHLLMSKVDDLYQSVCLHCHFGELWQQQVLLAMQVVLALCYTLGSIIPTRLAAMASWYLYLSLTLRNTWLNYILDRYFHYLLFLSIFLPWDNTTWTVSSLWKKNTTTTKQTSTPATTTLLLVTPATIAMKLLVVWIYMDAGYGKFVDPLGGWSYAADPLPALDSYARHTLVARYLYALIGPSGLRLLTPVVVYVELLAAPVALFGSYVGSPALVNVAVGLICSLHVGIALTLRNSALLSFVACTAWFVFLPIGWKNSCCVSHQSPRTRWAKLGHWLSILLIGSMVMGNLWLETISQACDQSVKHIWSTLLHNRWNVFVGAEEYVTWEIAPGLLQDGSVVDVWGRREEVNWNLPGGGAPCTSTSRPGRWRSFPYLAELEGEDGEALWSYLCQEWDRENDVERFPGRKLIRYNFFMLQADVLPNMAFSATRKRLIMTYECVPQNATASNNLDEVEPKKDEIGEQEAPRDEL